MRIFYLSLMILLSYAQQNKTILKDYVGGREGYSFVRLILYSDSTYKFTERFDFPGIQVDSGTWSLSKEVLRLDSFKSKNKMFNESTFSIMNGQLFLFDPKADSVFNYEYRTLELKNIER